MTAVQHRPRKQADAQRGAAGTAKADWRRARLVLLIAAVLPLAATAALRQARVPLGCPGRFVYLYSPVPAYRLAALPALVVLAGVAAGGTWLAGSERAAMRRSGLALVAAGVVGVGVWNYVAPPSFRHQHIFNIESPSQHGAFVREALGVGSVGDYLRHFPERAQMPPAAMRGTRVISNPPGTTLVAVGVERLVRRFPSVGRLALGPLANELPRDDAAAALQHWQAEGLVFLWVLGAAWLAAAAVLYGLGRLFFAPAAAAAYALCCALGPATLLLAPGKDTAQLLTVAVPLGFWLWALRRDRIVPAVVAGLAFVAACLASLVHVWVAGCVLGATLLSAERRGHAFMKLVLPAGATAVLAAVGMHVIWGVDLLATARSVAHAQAEVTRGPNAMPLAWQLLGTPLFLLFVGPAWLATTGWAVMPRLGLRGPGDGDARFGRYLLLTTCVAMLATVGFTNLETPRLWIPFVPLLLLGAMLQLAVLRRPERGGVRLLALLVVVQVIAAGLQWSLMDIRETETRLVEQRFFG